MSDSARKRTIVGNYFENLTAYLFGGKVQNGGNDSEFGTPDVSNYREQQIYEVKAIQRRDFAKIELEQARHYRNLIDAAFPTQPEAYYFFWVYTPPNNYPGRKLDDLENLLTSVHKALLILSFDIVEAGVRGWSHHGGSNGWAEYAAFRGSTRRQFYQDDNSALRNLDLHPEDYVKKEKEFRKRRYLKLELPGFRAKIIHQKDLRGLPAF